MNSNVRRQILSVYNFTCQYCNEQKDQDDLEVDHIYPKSLGGEDRLSNYTVACFHCNRKKKNSVPIESLRLLLVTVAERKAIVIEKRLLEAGQRKRVQSSSKPQLVQVPYTIQIRNSVEKWEEFTGRKVSISYPDCMSALQVNILLYLFETYKEYGGKVKVDLEQMKRIFNVSNFCGEVENSIHFGCMMYYFSSREVGNIISSCHMDSVDDSLENMEVEFAPYFGIIYEDVIGTLKGAEVRA